MIIEFNNALDFKSVRVTFTRTPKPRQQPKQALQKQGQAKRANAYLIVGVSEAKLRLHLSGGMKKEITAPAVEQGQERKC